MIYSQPSASKPRNARAAASPRRPVAGRRTAASRPELLESRWRVQLELAPAEIAFVYQKGLARGAEVCLRGTHEWRPLVTTPELRAALSTGEDPSLAALSLTRRAPRQTPKSAPPPPPVSKSSPPPPLQSTLVIPSPGPSTLLLPPPQSTLLLPTLATFATLAPLVRTGSIPDWEDTSPLRLRSDLPPALARTLPPPARSVLHARPVELSFVAAVAVALTFVLTSSVHRARRAPPRERSALEMSQGMASSALPHAADPAPESASAPSSPPRIPVFRLRDLPLEGARAPVAFAALASPAVVSAAAAPTRVARGAAAHAGPSSGPDRAALAQALARAASAAQNCGDGPVTAEIVATFAPSGVASEVHFATAPERSLRSCVLNAVARARLAPFEGDPVTVSKTIRW